MRTAERRLSRSRSSPAGPCAALLSALLLAACAREQTPAPTMTHAPAEASTVTASALFCAYGGVGLVPNPLPPGYETDFASMVVALDNPGAPITGVTVRDAALLDGSGARLSSMRRVANLVVLPRLETPGPSLGTFAVYLNPAGVPFDGTLRSGRTILRVRYSLDHGPVSLPNRCRLELDGLGRPLLIEGSVDGSWPT